MLDPLLGFSPAVRTWFKESFGRPTPPQTEGWPAIQRGEHTLILAPTGSGKTLAAFLWGLDELYRELTPPPTSHKQMDLAKAASPVPAPKHEANPKGGARLKDGVRLLYISPLKALNNDIERNLRVPLEGIRHTAGRLGQALPALRVAVRTGDTPQSERAQMLTHPPHILITTPESLYLMLTSPRAREMFRTIRRVIVDEIHTLAGNKRGAHLALSLERLTYLAEQPMQRIGLSATIRPLEEAARFLGGQEPVSDGAHQRPVSIVNAHYRKPLDLEVITVVEDFRDLPGNMIWPAIIPRVLDDIRRHHTTLIFANNRRLAERTADRLNAQLTAEQSEEIPPGSTEALAPGGIMRDRGIFGIGAKGPIRAHHGSMSKEARRQMEEDLKAGRLPALVGTSSLELGIDIGSVDVVVQLQSPKSVAQGLQRVGRSGHLVGQTSKGRIYPTFREDLAEAAAIARGMLDGDVELTYAPANPLDVLSQQIVAMVAVEDWPGSALYDLVRQAYSYRDLPLAVFHSVLDMLSGQYYLDLPQTEKGPVASLRPKIAWDRVHDRLTALPGTRLLAVSNPGTIPDTGAYSVYLADGKTRIGELDEEFVFETKPGDVFLLGSNVWRVARIDDDRLLVVDAAGATPRMPFWNGDYPYRPYELGERIGRFRRDIVERITTAAPAEVEIWLRREYALDENSARNLVAHVRRQLDAVGVISSDTTIVVESFQNAAGDAYLVVHSPFGGRVNGAWALALLSALRGLTGITPEARTDDDGLIFRFPQSAHDLPVEIIRHMTPADARERIERELPGSAVFGARFRMNAGRALLLPRSTAGKRIPFWLQRLRAKDLLALVWKLKDFPIVAETYRDCLQDVFDLPHLEQLLGRIQSGAVQVVSIETAVPSPVASSLLFNFVATYLYEWDAPKAERQLQALSITEAMASSGGPDALPAGDLSQLLRPEAIAEVGQRAQRRAPGYQARTPEELAFQLRELGDLTSAEVAAISTGDAAAWLASLAAEGRVVQLDIGSIARWVPVALADSYRAVFPAGAASAAVGNEAVAILKRFLHSSGPATRAAILTRYPVPADWLDATLAHLVATRAVVAGHFTAPDRDEFCEAPMLDQIRRRTLTLLRKEVQPVSLSAYADFLTRWQHVQPALRLSSPDGLRRVLEQLSGLALPGPLWEREVLPARLVDYDLLDLDALGQAGEIVWTGVPSAAGPDPRRGRIRIFGRGQGAVFRAREAVAEIQLSATAEAVHAFLIAEGASFTAELRAGVGLKLAGLDQALMELALGGLVTYDTLEPLRTWIATPAEAAAQRPARSSLEADLAARLATRPRTRPPTLTRYREAKMRVTQRLRAQAPLPASESSALPAPAGRWSTVQRAGVLGPSLSAEEGAEQMARLLLRRNGIVTYECLERETGPWSWWQLVPAYQRMELRGEIRRGYFVDGLSGLQFALPAAVDLLRQRNGLDGPVIVLNATDPVNIFGGEFRELDAPRFSRVPSTHVALLHGQPLAVFEDNGNRMSALPGVTLDRVQKAVAAYLARPNAARHVVVSLWNGGTVLGGDGRALLAGLGFQNTPTGMEWWAQP